MASSQRSETAAPAARSCAARASLFDGAMIGSCRPAAISTDVPRRSGGEAGVSGTIARSSTARRIVPGRSSSIAAAMFAPFENPTAVTLSGS